MAYDEGLAERVRSQIGDRPQLDEKKMFGGITFLISGNMAVGVSGDELMVRVGKDSHAEAVAMPGARTSEMGTRPMMGWVTVSSEGYATEEDLASWVSRGVSYAESLPAK